MIFVDTGPLVSRYVRDEHHAAATKGWKLLRRSKERLLTTNYVLDECVTLLKIGIGGTAAAERARNILASEAFQIERPGPTEELEALRLVEKYADQPGVSFTDCISFLYMQRHGLDRAFTFDRDFRRVGFRVWPE